MRILVGLALLSIAVPALADDAAPKQEHKICRREQATGTRSTTKICLTAAEWRERDANGSADDGAMGSKMKAYNDLGRGPLMGGGQQPH